MFGFSLSSGSKDRGSEERNDANRRRSNRSDSDVKLGMSEIELRQEITSCDYEVNAYSAPKSYLTQTDIKFRDERIILIDDLKQMLYPGNVQKLKAPPTLAQLRERGLAALEEDREEIERLQLAIDNDRKQRAQKTPKATRRSPVKTRSSKRKRSGSRNYSEYKIIQDLPIGKHTYDSIIDVKIDDTFYKFPKLVQSISEQSKEQVKSKLNALVREYVAVRSLQNKTEEFKDILVHLNNKALRLMQYYDARTDTDRDLFMILIFKKITDKELLVLESSNKFDDFNLSFKNEKFVLETSDPASKVMDELILGYISSEEKSRLCSIFREENLKLLISSCFSSCSRSTASLKMNLIGQLEREDEAMLIANPKRLLHKILILKRLTSGEILSLIFSSTTKNEVCCPACRFPVTAIVAENYKHQHCSLIEWLVNELGYCYSHSSKRLLCYRTRRYITGDMAMILNHLFNSEQH